MGQSDTNSRLNQRLDRDIRLSLSISDRDCVAARRAGEFSTYCRGRRGQQVADAGFGSATAGLASLGEALAGFPSALGFLRGPGIRVAVTGRERELLGAICDEVYRIACEAILNAFRHSGATEIEAEIDYRPTELRLIVRDNGCGIDAKRLQRERNEHRGLWDMRERAERIGARLRLLSSLALGTEVELCVPAPIAFEPALVRDGRASAHAC